MKWWLSALMLTMALAMPIKAEEMPRLIRVTCYCPESCPGTVTASGARPTEGRTCGSDKKLLGQVAAIYADDNGKLGEFIGYRVIEDSGSAPRVKNGNSIDVYQSNLANAKSWVNNYGDMLWVQFIDGKG